MHPPLGNVVRSIAVNRGHGYSLANQSGVIAAAIAQDAVVFAMRAPAADRSVYVDRLQLAVTTIAAFTTPVTAGRRIGVYRASNPGAEVSLGTDITAAIKKKDTNANVPASGVQMARMATTVALNTGGLVREAHPLAVIDLSAHGTAGARNAMCFDCAPPASHEWCFNPGEYICIVVMQAMDAVGTWQLTLNDLSWYEQLRTENTF